MPQPVPSMTQRTLSGLIWISLSTGANVGTLLLVLIVLARLLTPADFGLAAVAIMVIGFSAIFSEFGIGPAVVQRPELRPEHLGAGWTLSVVLGVALGAIIWLTAPLVAAFFDLAPLTAMLRTLAWIFPVQGLAVVSQSLLQRELRFRCLATLEVITSVLGYGVVGVTLALWGFGAWALVGAHLAQTGLKTVLSLIVRPHRIWPLVDRRGYADLLYFGGGFTAGRVSNYAAGQGEHVVIGYSLGAAALGIYGRAYQLMAGPAVLFGNVLDRVLFPAMVHVQHDPRRLADAYRRGTALVALVMLPVSALVVALAPEVVAVLLGPEWQEVVLPLQILGVGMLFRTSCKISDALVRATGAVYRRSWRQTVYAVLVVAGAWIGQWWGLEGVAIAILGTLVANFLLMAQLGLVITGMSWRSLAQAHVPGVALATAVVVPVVGTAALLRAGDVPALLVLVIATMAVAPALLAARWLPGVFLGADGQWMVGKLKAFLLRHAPEPETAAVATPDDHPLTLLTRGLSAECVRYCRWKAQVNVPRVLSGRGDLDLLVHPADLASFLRVAQGLGFKPLVPCFATLPDCELHLYGLDSDSGALLHVHAHTALLGERFTSLDQLVLRNCAPEKAAPLLDGMPVVQPAAELIAIVLRAMEQYARLGSAGHLARTRGKLQAKVAMLATADAGEHWRVLLARWLPSIPPAWFAECVAALGQPASWWRCFRLARRLSEPLVHAAPARRRALHGVDKPRRSLLGAAWWRLRHGGSPKRFAAGGAVIAIVGPDASGKSTLVTETAKWLGGVLRVQTAHLGKPPSAWLTLLPNLLLRLLRVATPSLRTSRQDTAPECDDRPRRRGLLYRLRAVILAWDRRALARRLARQAARGWMIVCDRYPSPAVGAPDSARLMDPADDGCTSRIGAWLARLENRLYRQIPAPDIVVRLNAPLAVAVNRNEVRDKPGKESADWVTRRHKQFFLPDFPHAKMLELDTNRPRGETVQALRQLVWAALDGSAKVRRAALPSQAAPHGALYGALHGALRAPLLVEFIGATGSGKSTLLAATILALQRQGVRVTTAEDLILARYGLSFVGGARLRSALVQLVTLLPFIRCLGNGDGRRLMRMALGEIARGMGGVRIGFSLLRNFAKRVGSHALLEAICRERCGWDIVLCDEGIVHAAHNLFVHTAVEPQAGAIEQFACLVPRPDLLVWVSAPAAQSRRVIQERGHARVGDTAEAAHDFAEHAHATFAALASTPRIAERMCTIDNAPVDASRCAEVVTARAAILAGLLQQRLYRVVGPMPDSAIEIPATVHPAAAPRHASRPARRTARRREMVRTP